jgi:hypothetical protein
MLSASDLRRAFGFVLWCLTATKMLARMCRTRSDSDQKTTQKYI